MAPHSFCINDVIYYRITDNGPCAELLLDTLGDELVNTVDKKQRSVTGPARCRALILSYRGKTRNVQLCGNGTEWMFADSVFSELMRATYLANIRF